MKRNQQFLVNTSNGNLKSSKELSLDSVSLADFLNLLREIAESVSGSEAEIRFWHCRASLLQLAAELNSLTALKRVNCREQYGVELTSCLQRFAKEIEKTQTVSEKTLERNLGIYYEHNS